MSRSLAVLAIVFAAVSLATNIAPAQDCNQHYSEWKQRIGDEGVYYYCTYTFEPAPGKQATNRVVWYPTKPDAGYLYYANSKGKYWCRALNELHQQSVKDKPQWNVVSVDANKKELLNAVPADAWGSPQHPICPGSNADGSKGCPMKAPPPPPVAEYTSFFKARETPPPKK
jgi:hypothetical protein